MNVTPATRIKQIDRTATRVIDGKAVIVVIDRQELHTLNEVGTMVWELAAEERSVAEVVGQVVGAFEVEEVQALQDVTAFVQELHGTGALEVRV